MTFGKNRIETISIAVFLMISFSASMILIPTSNAHTPAWQVPTYMYVSVSPNPIGVGQTVNVNFWVNIPPPTQLGPLGDRWQNLTVVVTAPDGSKKTLGPYPADTTGGTFTTYTPEVIGNYTFQSFFGGQTLTFPLGAGVGDYYQPSQSKPFTLTVQQNPISYPLVNSLPTDYWTRPIYAENNNWYTIAGNWLGFGCGIAPGVYNATGNYNPYSTAPTTAHILWTKPEAFGGTIGGEFGGSEQSNFYSTRQYETMFQPVIINGVLYYTEYPGSSTYPSGLVAVDLKTGQTLWTNNAVNYGGGSPTQSTLTAAGTVTNLINGQIINYVSPNQYGGLAYLWSTGTPNGINVAPGTTTFNMFDAKTGNYILSIVNGSSFSAMTEDQNGNLIGYYINSTNPNAPTLTEWNSTKAILTAQNDFFSAAGLAVWRPPQGGIIPFSKGIEWTAPMATNVSGNPITLSYSGISSGVILMAQYGPMGALIGSAFQSGWIVEAGYSANNGQLLWGPINRTENLGTRVSFGFTSNGNSGSAIGDGYWVESDLNALTVTGYNLLTGTQVWGPEALPNADSWDSLGMSQIVANGTIYIWGLGGDVYAINIATGTINWHYQTPSGGTESPYSVEPLWPSVGRAVIAGGILFVPEGHEFAPPLFHGAQQLALNITNGQVIWNITAMNVNGVKAVADGILTALNAYDNQIYAYGQGPSATAVYAPQVGVTTATPVTIAGTVMDISAGSKQQAVAANFPNGLPCVSDSSQSIWMEHVYMQQPMPTDVTGVPVILSVLDSNDNYRQIGTTTTDTSGTFAFTWIPDISGSFKVYATFAGTESYYGSSAEASFYASTAAATPIPTATTQANLATTTDLMMYMAVAVIAIIIAIAIATLLMLKKRP
jgi:outer membrane protein assembly factor BamB